MNSWQKKVTFTTYLDQAVNNGEYAVIERLFAPEFVGHFPDHTQPLLGVDGITEWTKELRRAFPAINTLIEGNWLVAEDDSHHVGKGTTAMRLAAYVVLRGKHDADYYGAPATGKFISWQQVHLIEFNGAGLISSDTVISDQFTLLSQLGLVSAPSELTHIPVPLELI